MGRMRGACLSLVIVSVLLLLTTVNAFVPLVLRVLRSPAQRFRLSEATMLSKQIRNIPLQSTTSDTVHATLKHRKRRVRSNIKKLPIPVTHDRVGKLFSPFLSKVGIIASPKIAIVATAAVTAYVF